MARSTSGELTTVWKKRRKHSRPGKLLEEKEQRLVNDLFTLRELARRLLGEEEDQ